MLLSDIGDVIWEGAWDVEGFLVGTIYVLFCVSHRNSLEVRASQMRFSEGPRRVVSPVVGAVTSVFLALQLQGSHDPQAWIMYRQSDDMILSETDICTQRDSYFFNWRMAVALVLRMYYIGSLVLSNWENFLFVYLQQRFQVNLLKDTYIIQMYNGPKKYLEA